MLRNSQNLTTASNEVVVNIALAKYFECHSVQQATAQLNDLLHAWQSNCRLFKCHTDICNMVFFATNTLRLLRTVNSLDGAVTPVDNLTSKRIFVLEFFNNFDFSFGEEIIEEALQNWICPELYRGTSSKRSKAAQKSFASMIMFINACEEVLEGGVLCD